MWVVCKTCERWNLSPIETRWEAIEDAERAFRSTKLRVSTDNIALAQLKDGTELVRIGKPPRLEFAAWRYGDRFGKRWRKYAAGTAIATFGPYGQLVTNGANIAYGLWRYDDAYYAVASTSLFAAAFAMAGAATSNIRGRRDARPAAVVHDGTGAPLRVSRRFMDISTLAKSGVGGQLALALYHFRPFDKNSGWETQALHEENQHPRDMSMSILSGDHALRALSTMLPHVNRLGARKNTVDQAVGVIAESNDLSDIMRGARPSWWIRTIGRYRGDAVQLKQVAAPLRLAAEMSLHESDEHRAMEGELHELERRWKEADAIAKISDDMFLPNITQPESA